LTHPPDDKSVDDAETRPDLPDEGVSPDPVHEPESRVEEGRRRREARRAAKPARRRRSVAIAASVAVLLAGLAGVGAAVAAGALGRHVPAARVRLPGSTAAAHATVLLEASSRAAGSTVPSGAPSAVTEYALAYPAPAVDPTVIRSLRPKHRVMSPGCVPFTAFL
jgi:hypothetical protein